MKMVFEVGDVVRLVSSRPKTWSSNGSMDIFLDTIQVISRVSSPYVYFVNPATHQRSFQICDIAGFEKDQLNSAQIARLTNLHAVFPEGQKFFSAMSGKKFTSKGLLYGKIEDTYFNVLDKGENYIQYRGKTAELRETKPSFTFAGNLVTYNKDNGYLSIGCKDIDSDDIELLNQLCSQYNITSVVVDGNRTVTPGDLRTWIDFINKQY